MVKAFSARPCIGILGENKFPNNGNVKAHELPVLRHVSKECNVWSGEAYTEEKGNYFGAAVCLSCRKIGEELQEINPSESKVDTGGSSQIKEEFHDELMTKPDIESMQTYNLDFDNGGLNDNDELFTDLDEGQFLNEINNETTKSVKSQVQVAKSAKKKKSATKKRIKNGGVQADYHYTGPIAVINDEVTRELKIIPVQETAPQREYIGDLHPFHDQIDWMAILFPQAEDPICPLCQSKFRSSGFLILHLKLKHAFDWYQCSECKIWRNQPGEIISHWEEMHNGVDAELICPCCKIPISIKELEDHCLSCFLNKYDRRNLPFINSTHYKASYYKCHLCPEDFNERVNYLTHLKTYHDNEVLKCDKDGCDYIATRGPCQLQLHKLRAHKENADPTEAPSELKICDICGRKFSVLSVLLNHKRNEHNVTTHVLRQFPCHECDKTFGSKDTRESHINTVHLKLSFDCVECGKSFARKIKLQQHKLKVHSKEDIKEQCDVCQEWFCNKETVDNHKRKAHTGERPFVCLFCGNAYFSATQMNLHRRTKHPDSWAAEKKRRIWLRDNKGKDPNEYKIQCHLCDQKTPTIEVLRSHWDEKHPGETDNSRGGPTIQENGLYICEHCGSKFPTINGLRSHVVQKHATPKYKPKVTCEICGKAISTKTHLIIHKMRIHKMTFEGVNGGKKYVPDKLLCDICGASSTSPYSLRIHKEELHLNDSKKPKNCTYCDKEFPTYARMTGHRRIAHLQQYTADKDVLLRQEGSRYLGKEHPSKRFYRKNSTCATCGKTLCSRQQLHFHMKALHGAGLPDYCSRS